MLRNVLLPTDGSGAALLAAETLSELIDNPADSKVTVAIVIEPLSSETSDFDEEIIQRHNNKMRARAQSAIDSTCRIFARKNIPYASKIIEGDPVSAVLAQDVERHNYDVVVMGSRGLGMQKDSLHYLGSVTEHVIRRVDIPVLVLPIHKDK
jgi:nucleotide-binding universal stress UspA family protein